MTFDEVLRKALDGMGKSALIYAEVDEAVATVVENAALLAKSRDVDVTDMLNGDPEHDRAILDAAEIEGALNSSIDWSAVPVAVLETAWTVLKAATAIAAVL
jgi:hypothetical protein